MAAHDNITKKSVDLHEPLLKRDEDSSDDDEDSMYSSSTQSKVKTTPLQKLKSLMVTLCLIAAEAASVAAIILDPGNMVYVMAGITMFNSLLSVFKEYHIMKLPSLRNLNNKLREEANQLQDEVNILAEEIEFLKPEAQRASVVEEELKLIADKHNCNVDKLVAAVKENESILALMRDNLRQKVIQDVVKIVMLSDEDNSGDFCKAELKTLVLKIHMQLLEYGVEFDERKFYCLMSANPSVECALSIVKRLIPATNDEENEYLKQSECEEDKQVVAADDVGDDLYDIFHISDPGSSLCALHGGAEKRMSLSLPESSLETNQRRKSYATRRPSSSKVPNFPSSYEKAPSLNRRKKSDKLKAAINRSNSWREWFR